MVPISLMARLEADKNAEEAERRRLGKLLLHSEKRIITLQNKLLEIEDWLGVVITCGRLDLIKCGAEAVRLEIKDLFKSEEARPNESPARLNSPSSA